MRLRNKKTAEALHYLLANSKERKLSILLLLKLLFFADRHLLLHEGKTISNSKYVAMKLGPVSSRANNILYKKICYLNEDSDDYINNYFSFNYVTPKYNSLVSIKNISQYTSLSSFDKEALNIALKIFKIEPNLCELSHKFYEWKKHES